MAAEEINRTNIFKKVLGEQYDLSAVERGLRKGVKVLLFFATGSSPIEVGTAKLSTAGDSSSQLQRVLHLHELPSNTQDDQDDLVVITDVVIGPGQVNHPYPYTFQGGEGPPATLGGLFQAGMYAWDTRMMIAKHDNDKNASTQSGSGDRARSTKGAGLGRSVGVEVIDSDGEEDVSDGKDLDIKPYDASLYVKYEIKVLLSQMVLPPNTLRLVSQAHVEGLQHRFLKFGYEYSSGLMTVTVRLHENEDLGSISIANITQGSAAGLQNQQSLLASVNAVLVDGVHRRQSLLNISKMSSDGVLSKWPTEPLRVHIILRKDGADLCNTEILQIGSQRNHVTSTVRPFETLEDHIFAVMSYLQSFAAEGGISVEEIRPSNVALQMNTVDLIPGMKPDTYRRYSRIAKLFLKHPRAFDKLKYLKPDIRPKIGAVHLDNSILFSIDELCLLLFLDSINAYIRNPSSSGSFLSTPFFQNAKDLYETCRHAFNSHGISRQMGFEEFLSIEIPYTKTKWITISNLFINHMRLFSDRTRAEREKMSLRATRFRSRINSFFASKETPSKDPSKVEKGKRSERSRQMGDEQHLDEPSRRSSEQIVLRKSSRTRKASASDEPPEASPSSRSKQRKRKRSLVKVPRRVRRRFEASEESGELTDGEGYRVPITHKDIGPFDDLVSPSPPHGVKNAEVYNGEKGPWWQSAVSLPPCKVEKILQEAKSKGVNFHHTTWLRALHIPCEHRAHLYADFNILQYLHRLAWLLASKASLTRSKSLAPTLSEFLSDKWEDALHVYKSGMGSDVFARYNEDLNHKGFCILEGFADDAVVPNAIRGEIKHSPSHSNGSIWDLFSHYQHCQTFPGENNLKREESWNNWAPIINVGVDSLDESDRYAGKSRFSTTRALLMDVTEKSSSTVWASIRRAYLDVWVGQLAVLIGIHNHSSEKFWIPNTGGRFLLTGKGCPRQAAHNDFQVPHKSNKQKAPGYFCIVSADNGFPIWVSEYSHLFVFKTVSDLRHIGPRLSLRKVIVPPNSVFFGHGYLTHAGAGFESRICDLKTIRYHLYLIPEDRQLPDSIFYAFPLPPKFEDEDPLIEIEKGADEAMKHKDKRGRPKGRVEIIEGSDAIDSGESVDQDDDVLLNESEGTSEPE